MDARLVTMNDLYAFDPDVHASIDEFTDLIGRHFKQPREGARLRQYASEPYVAHHH